LIAGQVVVVHWWGTFYEKWYGYREYFGEIDREVMTKMQQ